ncbi:MAG TPA: PLP-dependent aminotransferase family protein [Streptosporangiaceae bacterium]|nr:PLP-dependent aminotransferase family protein [Streptosporangiaceae bacterium]
MRTTTELPLAAERGQQLTLSAQIAGQIREAITAGRLVTADRLPATRALASTLGVSRTVISSAYAQLFAEGWIEGRHGSGTYVANGATPGHGRAPRDPVSGGGTAPGGTAPGDGLVPGGGPERAAGVALWRDPAYGGASAPTDGTTDRARQPAGVRDRPHPQGVRDRPLPAGVPDRPHPQGARDRPHLGPLIELRPGIPWAAGIDAAAWRRAWRQAGRHRPAFEPDPRGLPGLRDALTGYLRRSRGVHCTPEQVVVTRGVAGSLRLLAAALLRPGDRVGVEEPGYPAAREVLAAHGARVVPCRTDQDGLVVTELPAGLRLVYTTPAHQYPLGGRLPVPRRQALVAWARATGALIVEDDYDGEFRYDVAPLPSLSGLGPDVVAYLGTTTKILTPALSTGWLVARPDLATRVAETARRLGDRPGEGPQAAVHALITGGDLERHIRRMRHEYARRRAVIARLLGPVAPGRLLGDTAGMHVVLALPGERASRVAAAAAGRGVAVGTLDRYYSGPVTAGGLVLGYGGASLADVTRGCQVLAGIL